MKTLRHTLTVAAALLLLALVPSAALAQDDWTSWDANFILKPTPYGETCGASGTVHIGRKGEREFLEVQMFAKMADGTELQVLGQNKKDQWFTVGTVSIVDGRGYLWCWEKLGPEPSPLFPLSQLKRMLIYENRQLVLKTTFARLPGL